MARTVNSIMGSAGIGPAPAGTGIMGNAPPPMNYGATGTQPNGDYVDEQGTRWRQAGNEWLKVSSNGSLIRPGDEAEINARYAGTNLSGNAENNTYPAGNPQLGYAYPPASPAKAGRTVGSVQGSTGMGIAPGLNPQQQIADILNNTSASDDWYTGQKQRDDTYLGSLGGIVNGANASDLAALGTYNGIVNPAIASLQGLQAPTWQNFNSNPQDVQRQQAAYDWAQGAAYGSLDYTAQQAGMQNASYQGYQAQNANYQTYQAQQAALALAQLHQYASNPEDVQRQLTGLGNIQQDIAHGGDGQRKILEQIYQDIQSGGTGQRDAIERLKQELATGGNDQREVMNKYKALSDPQVTAQERYLAEIARRSFESQDSSNREAVLQDQAARGLRSGGSEISSALANQQRFGQDRTLAELGLQANAVQRSQVAMQGWQQSADSLRSAQQSGLAMYTNAQNALRAAQQQGIAMAADEENALRQAQQQGLAMYQQAADSIRAMNDQVGLANTGWANQNSIANAGFKNQNAQFNANANNQANQFNANAYNENSMFNANANNNANQFNANAYNQNSQFNANAYNMNQQFNANANNTAMANNQGARVQGGVAMNNTANSIRSANDAIGMFNTNGSQISQQFAANFGVQKASTLGGLAQTQFGNTTGVTANNAARSGGLAQSTWQVPSSTEAERLRQQEAQKVNSVSAVGFLGLPPRPGKMI